LASANTGPHFDDKQMFDAKQHELFKPDFPKAICLFHSNVYICAMDEKRMSF